MLTLHGSRSGIAKMFTLHGSRNGMVKLFTLHGSRSGMVKRTNYSKTAMCHMYVKTQYISTKFGIHVRYVNST